MDAIIASLKRACFLGALAKAVERVVTARFDVCWWGSFSICFGFLDWRVGWRCCLCIFRYVCPELQYQYLYGIVLTLSSSSSPSSSFTPVIIKHKLVEVHYPISGIPIHKLWFDLSAIVCNAIHIWSNYCKSVFIIIRHNVGKETKNTRYRYELFQTKQL